jgi:hypothetical protein
LAEILPGRLDPAGENRHLLGGELIRTVEELWDVVATSVDRAELEGELEASRAEEARLLERCG